MQNPNALTREWNISFSGSGFGHEGATSDRTREKKLTRERILFGQTAGEKKGTSWVSAAGASRASAAGSAASSDAEDAVLNSA